VIVPRLLSALVGSSNSLLPITGQPGEWVGLSTEALVLHGATGSGVEGRPPLGPA
jgi:hypothetical protein